MNNLGGSAGFGESFLVRNDDSSTGFIDLRSVFGSQGINFFGVSYTGLYLNNNGNLTFTGPIGNYTPSAITGNTANPLIAAYWADVDTRGSTVTARPGGTSTGSNLQIIKVRVLRDAVPEGNEGFLLTLFAPVGAAIGDGSASGLIRNDDFAPTAFSFASELHLLG
ncbi:nidogen-like domain-containing protein [Roseomonas sp. F4]